MEKGGTSGHLQHVKALHLNCVWNDTGVKTKQGNPAKSAQQSPIHQLDLRFSPVLSASVRSHNDHLGPAARPPIPTSRPGGREHHQHQLGLGAGGGAQFSGGGLRLRQGGRGQPDPAAGRGVGARRHPRERHRSRHLQNDIGGESNKPLWGEAFQAHVNDRMPLQRIGMPDELKGTAIFLASEASCLVTGHILPVDGGWLAW